MGSYPLSWVITKVNSSGKFFLSTGSVKKGFPGGSDSKEFSCNAAYPGLIPGLGRSRAEGNGYPLQYSWLENSMERGAWWAVVHVFAKSQTQLSD